MSNIENIIENLKNKMNSYERAMYDASVEGSKRVNISSFNPDQINEGDEQTITCDVSSGLPDAPAGTLRGMGGIFTSEQTGQTFTFETVLIIDPQTYTSFQIETPALPAGTYTITIFLGPSGKLGDTYELVSITPLRVSPSITPLISRITPRLVSKDELKKTTFTIFGRELQKIQTSTGFYLQISTYKFQYVGPLENTSVKVRYSASAQVPDPKTYRVLAKDSNGAVISSQANLTIE